MAATSQLVQAHPPDPSSQESPSAPPRTPVKRKLPRPHGEGDVQQASHIKLRKSLTGEALVVFENNLKLIRECTAIDESPQCRALLVEKEHLQNMFPTTYGAPSDGPLKTWEIRGQRCTDTIKPGDEVYFAEIGSVSGKRPNQSIKLAGYGVYCETKELSYADFETFYTCHRVTSSDLAHISKSWQHGKLFAWVFTEMTPVAAWRIPYKQVAHKLIKFDKPSIVKPDLAMFASPALAED